MTRPCASRPGICYGHWVSRHRPSNPPRQFLQSAPVTEWSCVISDVNMPGLSGIELQRSLLARGRRIPFIFITAFPDQAVQDRALKAGAAGFLSKPFAGCDLIECLERALRRKIPNQY